ncbi:polymorphic toxin type 34 domain-containing protein [Nocardia sp. NPDC051321]|uniref:polymorphic toxin type 34 domain-containing protein n=1 Tax=Nocardia sp. NPDC051321 TaxID=3364323 RepID=UPI0037BCFFAF
MAGDYAQVRDWASAYDSHVREFVTTATTLANAVQNMGDLLAYAGYNYALTEHLNIDPTTGTATASPPEQPPISTPLYGADGPVLIPATVIGNPGSGITTNIPGLLDHISSPVPNGDTSLLTNVADAWRTFANHDTVMSTSDTLKSISATLTADLHAPDIEHFADHFTTLAASASDLHSAAAGIAPLVASHHDNLDALRTNIHSDTDGLVVKLAAIAVAAAVVIILTTIFTAGLSLAGGDEAEAGAATAAGAATIATVGETITGAIAAFVSAVLEGATGAFAAVTALSATELEAIAALTVASVAGAMVAEMAKGGKKNVGDTGIENEMRGLLESGAAATACEALGQLWDAASSDSKRRQRIKATQKKYGCRHSSGGGGR